MFGSLNKLYVENMASTSSHGLYSIAKQSFKVWDDFFLPAKAKNWPTFLKAKKEPYK